MSGAAGQLGKVEEFDEAAAIAEAAKAPAMDSASASARGRRMGGAGVALVTKSGVSICESAPLTTHFVPGPGGKQRPVEVIDKQAVFTVPLVELRARWMDVCIRPGSGRVLVYDGTGKTLARFEDMAQAEKVFAEAEILAAVRDRLKKQREHREKMEKAAAAQQARK